MFKERIQRLLEKRITKKLNRFFPDCIFELSTHEDEVKFVEITCLTPEPLSSREIGLICKVTDSSLALTEEHGDLKKYIFRSY